MGSTVKDDRIKRTICFGSSERTYPPLHEDTFALTKHLWTSVPVYGPTLTVRVDSQLTAAVDITIYAVREVS